MRTLSLFLALSLLTGPPAAAEDAAEEPAREAPEIATLGELAPDFKLKDLDGEEVGLSDFEGKTVVLEWFNPDCPFVQYAHGQGGPLASLPGRHISESLVWLAINSGAPGKQGHGAARNKQAVEDYGMDYPVLLDERGEVGRRYEARTTPHLYIIDPSGTLVYRGALDSAPMGRGAGETVDYVSQALEALKAGAAVPQPETRSYGCSVKYGS